MEGGRGVSPRQEHQHRHLRSTSPTTTAGQIASSAASRAKRNARMLAASWTLANCKISTTQVGAEVRRGDGDNDVGVTPTRVPTLTPLPATLKQLSSLY